jgi:hypothetical protein
MSQGNKLRYKDNRGTRRQIFILISLTESNQIPMERWGYHKGHLSVTKAHLSLRAPHEVTGPFFMSRFSSTPEMVSSVSTSRDPTMGKADPLHNLP